MEESLDRAIQLPLAEEIEELTSLIIDLQAGWDKLVAPTTSAPYSKEEQSSSILA